MYFLEFKKSNNINFYVCCLMTSTKFQLQVNIKNKSLPGFGQCFFPGASAELCERDADDEWVSRRSERSVTAMRRPS